MLTLQSRLKPYYTLKSKQRIEFQSSDPNFSPKETSFSQKLKEKAESIATRWGKKIAKKLLARLIKTDNDEMILKLALPNEHKDSWKAQLLGKLLKNPTIKQRLTEFLAEED